MADPRKHKVVDGFTTIRAVKEAARHGAPGAPEPPAAPAPGAPPEPGKPGGRIGRTVLPSRTEIVCAGCGHAFELTGKNAQTICPKCRLRLVIQDWTIEGEWDQDITTAGTVTVKPEGIIRGGTITANNLEVHGRVEGGALRVTRRLALHAGAAWPGGGIPCRDLWLGEGAEYTAGEPGLEVRHAELHGLFTGPLSCAGKCVIHPTGGLEGRLSAARLEVHEGGGLLGDIRIVAPAPPTPPARA
jgi:cytoskeletal protein CcmA (bactofilin family)